MKRKFPAEQPSSIIEKASVCQRVFPFLLAFPSFVHFFFLLFTSFLHLFAGISEPLLSSSAPLRPLRRTATSGTNVTDEKLALVHLNPDMGQQVDGFTKLLLPLPTN